MAHKYGLTKHRVEPVKEFDGEKAFDYLREVVREIAGKGYGDGSDRVPGMGGYGKAGLNGGTGQCGDRGC